MRFLSTMHLKAVMHQKDCIATYLTTAALSVRIENKIPPIRRPLCLLLTHSTPIRIVWSVFLTPLKVNLHLLFSLGLSVTKRIQLRVFIPSRFLALSMNQTFSVADKVRHSESLLDLQGIKPRTHCVSTGTFWP